MKYRILTILFVLLSCNFFFAQEKQDYVHFSGVIISTDSLDLISYASLVDKTTRTGTMADQSGYFNFIAKPGDTILFSAFGFKSNSYIIPDTLTQPRYSIIHLMVPETLIFPEVEVFPWPSKEQFAKAFVEMDPYDGQIRRLSHKLSGEELNETASRLRVDPDESYKWDFYQRQTAIYTHGMFPVDNLLNPFAWSKFIDAWKSGDLQRE